MGYKIEVNRKYFKVAVVIILVIALFLLTFAVLTHFEKINNPEIESDYRYTPGTEDAERQSVYFRDATYYYKKNLETVLVIGIDKFDDNAANNGTNRNNMQSDFLFLAVIDKDTNECKAIHIDRDSIVKLPLFDVFGNESGETTGQIALSHTYGSGGKDSCEYTVKAASELLYGIKIDHYVALQMEAVPIVNDLVGGVTVTVNDDFSDVEPEFVIGEQITLKGEQALTFVRSRGGMNDPTNAARMVRQRDYIESLMYSYRKSEEENSNFSLDVLFKINDYMTSDCTINELSEILDSLINFDIGGGIQTIDGESEIVAGYMEFHPDEEKLKELVISIFYDREEIPSTESDEETTQQ